mgnify:FL=1
MQENNYNKTSSFGFNLVPPKTKEELVVLEERDNSILYSFLLVFFSMFIYFVLNMIQTFVINQRIEQGNVQIIEQEASFSAYDEIKRVRGELITKGELLEPVLKKDIKLTEVLDLANQISIDNPTVNVTTYSREATGEFVLTFSMPDIPTASTLVEYLNKNDKLLNVFARNVQYIQDESEVSATISFSLLNV